MFFIIHVLPSKQFVLVSFLLVLPRLCFYYSVKNTETVRKFLFDFRLWGTLFGEEWYFSVLAQENST